MKKTLTLLLTVFLMLFVGCSSTTNDKMTKQAEAKDEEVKEEVVNEEAAKEEAVSEEAAVEEAVNEEAAVDETASNDMNKFENVGIDLDLTGLIDNSKGLVVPNPIGLFDSNHHIYVMPIYYVAMPKEEAAGIMYSGDSSQEELQKLYAAQVPINIIVASDIDYDATVKGLSESLQIDYSEEMARAEVIGTADGFTFYAVPDKEEAAKYSTFDAEYAEEFDKLRQELLDLEKSARLYAPVDELKEMVGQKIEFTTTDLDGNTVTSAELFSANEITMINCWGLWCGNCLKEMAELKEIHERIQEKGCGIVGMEFEYDWNDDAVQQSKELFSETGITYPNVIIPEELNALVPGFPTTIFVDKEGYILCPPILGVHVNAYESTLDELLNGNTVTETTETAADDTANANAENQDILYKVFVTDENGPVGGVTIQFCSTTSCMMGKTDANGLTSFSMPAGEIYEVHVLRVPEGYEKDEAVYHTTNESSFVEIQLKKQ